MGLEGGRGIAGASVWWLRPGRHLGERGAVVEEVVRWLRCQGRIHQQDCEQNSSSGSQEPLRAGADWTQTGHLMIFGDWMIGLLKHFGACIRYPPPLIVVGKALVSKNHYEMVLSLW